RASRGEVEDTSRPAKKMRPESGTTAPARIVIGGDLPAAVPPTGPTTSPGATRRVAPRRASAPPERRRVSCIRTRSGAWVPVIRSASVDGAEAVDVLRGHDLHGDVDALLGLRAVDDGVRLLDRLIPLGLGVLLDHGRDEAGVDPGDRLLGE